MTNILHTIKAYLYDNPLTPDPNDYIARADSERALGVKEICQTAVNRGSSDIPAAAMEHAVSLFLKEMAYQLCDGYSVNTGYFSANAHIRGVFNSPGETYDPAKHSFLFLFNQGELLRAEIPTIEITMMGVAENRAVIMQVKDIKTGSVNDLITPGKNLRIIGSKIKVAGDSPNNGIFFENTSTGTRTMVDPSDIVTNNPSELMIVIPALPSGSYILEVVTQYSKGQSFLLDPRVARFESPLSVQ